MESRQQFLAAGMSTVVWPNNLDKYGPVFYALAAWLLFIGLVRYTQQGSGEAK